MNLRHGNSYYSCTESPELSETSVSSLWKSWKKTWERFAIAPRIDESGGKRRMCTLLYITREDAVKVCGDGESEDITQDVLNKFEEYCNPT